MPTVPKMGPYRFFCASLDYNEPPTYCCDSGGFCCPFSRCSLSSFTRQRRVVRLPGAKISGFATRAVRAWLRREGCARERFEKGRRSRRCPANVLSRLSLCELTAAATVLSLLLQTVGITLEAMPGDGRLGRVREDAQRSGRRRHRY